jgi:hypothetical protein
MPTELLVMGRLNKFSILQLILHCATTYLLLFIAAIGVNSCFKASECESLMAKLFSSRSSEFISGGCIDAKHAYLYPSNYYDVLMFVSVNKDTFIIDSIVNFNRSFAKYASVEELEQATYKAAINKIVDGKQESSNVKYELPNGEFSFQQAHSIIYRRKNNYQLVANNGVYEISFQDKTFIQSLEFVQIESERQNEICDTSSFKEHEFRKVHFFPEYTKITFTNSHLILYENGKIIANAEPTYCLYVRILNLEKIIVFGSDCIVEENCEY